jgi:hypothetical protein
LESKEAGSTIAAVRRLFAILLVALFSFSLMAPALSSGAETNIPECCRRAGKHHCSTSSGSAQPSGPVFNSGGHCPLYPDSLLPTSVPSTFLAIFALALLFPVATEGAFRQLAAARFGSLFSTRSHPKRGPPFFPSFA